MLPERLENFNFFVDARGLAGLAEEVKLPQLARDMEDYIAAGMIGPVKLTKSLKAMDLEFTLGEFTHWVITLFGVTDPSGIQGRFLGACPSGDGSSVAAIEISVRGKWEELDQGTAKPKDPAKMKVKMPLTYYRYSRNNQVLIEIDMISGIFVVGGVDKSAATRRALGMTA